VVKRSGREDDHYLSPCAKGKSVELCLHSHIRLHDVVLLLVSAGAAFTPHLLYT
jgi:hypothetical protein